MGQKYRLVGSQDPASRIDNVVVEEPSADSPEGKRLQLNGSPVELSDDQVVSLSNFVRLEVVDEDAEYAAEYRPEDYPDEEERSEEQPQPSESSEPQPEADPASQAANVVAKPRARKEV